MKMNDDMNISQAKKKKGSKLFIDYQNFNGN